MDNHLTPTQLVVLRGVAEGEVLRSESGASLYTSFDANGRNVNSKVDALRAKNLIEIGSRVPGQLARFWQLTDAGRAVLDARRKGR